VALGIDRVSSSGSKFEKVIKVEAINGTGSLRLAVAPRVRRLGGVSVDAFASKSNALAQLFWSWFD
jgi:hypothetical protein